MSEPIDLAIIGAGPAGMAAAALAAGHGLDVVVYDENQAPGGQIYRGFEAVAADRAADLDFLGDSYRAGLAIAHAFRASRARYQPSTSVWLIQKDRTIGISHAGRARMVEARRILIATGAMERPVPIPGWTLPGVMTVGAAQTALKAAGLVPRGPVVLGGKGPLLYQLAAQYLGAGVTIAAILETGARPLAALPHLVQAWWRTDYLEKGLALLRQIKNAGVTIIKNVSGLRAIGDGKLDAVEYRCGGTVQRIAAPLLLLHEGVIANVQLTMAIPAAHRWDEAQRCWHPVVDEYGDTDLEGIAVAGDGAGIGGAEAAASMGRLAALAAVHALGKISDGEFREIGYDLQRERRRYLAGRPFLDALYPPPAVAAALADDTLVCRCEEVSAGEIRRAVALGCTGPNQTKSFTRAGMGPCQGRMCGLTVAEVIADRLDRPMAEVGYYRIRPPIKPLTVGELAGLE
ncbi:MAG: FAD-binding protein [Alphaproteobacteria bacterium]|nr:FAD-binding protein [Alphaproteobacteria bacterium]MBM3733894.1 FAD-binding protein [Acidimicrobiia bacterium]